MYQGVKPWGDRVLLTVTYTIVGSGWTTIVGPKKVIMVGGTLMYCHISNDVNRGLVMEMILFAVEKGDCR